MACSESGSLLARATTALSLSPSCKQSCSESASLQDRENGGMAIPKPATRTQCDAEAGGATSCSAQCCICQRRCNASTSGLGPLASLFCLAAWSSACSAWSESPPSCSASQSPAGASLTASAKAGVVAALARVSSLPCTVVREHGVAAPGVTTSNLIGNSSCSVCSFCSGSTLSGARAAGARWYSCCSRRAASLPCTARCFPSANNLSGAAIACQILGFRGYRPSYTHSCIHLSIMIPCITQSDSQ